MAEPEGGRPADAGLPPEPVEAEGLFARVDAGEVDPEELRARVRGEASGAVVVFLGTVRRENRSRPVVSLSYEAYEEMAVEELGRVCREALERFDVDAVAAHHRTGELRPGQASVGVAVAGGHRGPTFEATRWIMEELKRRVPLWKLERYEDGEERWLDGAAPAPTGERGEVED